MYDLVLASQSPRRKQILEDAGYLLHTLSLEISEILEENLNIEEQIMGLARRKAEAATNSGKLLNFKGKLLLSADTVVVMGDQIFGKPSTSVQAFDTLTSLSGNRHQVITAFCLVDVLAKEMLLDYEVTHISFKELSSAEIKNYILSGEPFDKAGAYGIQGLAKNFIQSIDGDFQNVVGLPLKKIEKRLEERGWNVRKR